MARASGERPVTLRAGPWKGVLDTTDPGDDRYDFLRDARNLYIPDPGRGSGAFSRPGYSLANSASQLGQAASRRGQGLYTHIAEDGTAYNFIACGGKLYRTDSTLTVFTDVTPVGVSITSGLTSRVYFESLGDTLIVTDGVNRPWLGTNLSATPITGTYVDYDGGGTAWSAYGRPTVYGGAVFFIMDIDGASSARSDLIWSEPNQPGVGYQQTNYDNRWTLSQTSGAPIYAILGTNAALYYWREDSIGTISGPVGPDLSTSSTHDAVSFHIGTMFPASVQLYGNTIFFCDQIGRPHRMQVGGRPDEIWLQMRRIVDTSSAAFPAVTKTTCSAAIETTLNLYVAAIWSSVPASIHPAVEMYVFDAKTGVYLGRWDVNGGCSIDCIGTLLDNDGRGQFVALGSKIVDGDGGYVWGLRSLVGTSTPLTTEAADLLVTEDGLSTLATEGVDEVWTDNGAVPAISATTHRLGNYDDESIILDEAAAIVGSAANVSLTAASPNSAGTSEGSASSGASQDGTYAIGWGLDGISGRSVELTVAPVTAASQWVLYKVLAKGIVVPTEADEY